MSIEANKQIVRQFHDATTAGNIEAALVLLAPDATLWLPADEPGGTVMTKEELPLLFASFSTLFNQAPVIELRSMTAEEDRVALEKTTRGGITHGGARYDNDYFMFFRLRDGKIVEIREYLDPRRVEPLVAELQASPATN